MIYFLTDKQSYNGKHPNVYIGWKPVSVPATRGDYYAHAVEAYRSAYKARQAMAPPGITYRGLGLSLHGGRGAYETITRNLAQYELPDSVHWYLGVPRLLKLIDWLEDGHRDAPSRVLMGRFWDLRFGRVLHQSPELERLDAASAARGVAAPFDAQVVASDARQAKNEPGYHARKIVSRRRARAEKAFQRALDNGMLVHKP